VWPCQPWCNHLRRRPSLFSYNNNEIQISRIVLKYTSYSFYVLNVVKETCTPGTKLLSDFDGWPHTYSRFRNFKVMIQYKTLGTFLLYARHTDYKLQWEIRHWKALDAYITGNIIVFGGRALKGPYRRAKHWKMQNFCLLLWHSAVVTR